MIVEPALLAAFTSSCAYFAGFAFLKIAATRMDPLLGTRPVHLGRQVVADPAWWCGIVIMFGGMLLQLRALSSIPLTRAVPALLTGLVVLVILACGPFGERATAGEWACFGLMLAAGLVFARSVPPDAPPPSTTLFVLVAIPSFALPAAVFALGDRRPGGRHARPLTGIAYGLSSGVLIGLAELALSRLARDPLDPAPLYVLVFLAAVAVGVLQLHIALQRCRMIAVVFVATIVAKVFLLLVGGLLTSVHHSVSAWGPLGGFALAVTAFALMPRFDMANGRRR